MNIYALMRLFTIRLRMIGAIGVVLGLLGLLGGAGMLGMFRIHGLAQDFVGYIVPAYNYVLHPTSPYLDEADGDHYEETYSLGPEVERHVVHPIMALVGFRP